ncbi:MAG TPA: N-acetylmuramoyl-L-alanine amidase [Candidatus Acidoferrales bacterium]
MKSAIRPRAAADRFFLRLLLANAFLLCVFPSVRAQSSAKKEAAQAQYDRAEKLRAALESKPAGERPLSDYKQAVSSYRRVYLITPHAAQVPAALTAIAELNIEMGQRFGSKYFQAAVDAYQFLLHQYPASKNREDALLAIASIQKDDLGQPDLAAKSYEEFLKLHPKSPHRREALEGLAEIAISRPAPGPEQPAAQPAAAGRPGNSKNDGEDSVKPDASIPLIKRITASSTKDFTRIVIALENAVEFQSARIKNPDRIFFDLHQAKLAPGLAGKTIEGSGLLKTIRVAQNQAGVVRVVLDVNGAESYSASLLKNPYRLVIDLGSEAELAKKTNADPAESPVTEKPVSSAAKRNARRDQPSAAASEDTAKTESPRDTPTRSGSNAKSESARSRSMKVTHSAAARLAAPAAPQPTRDGQQSLTRALGLKVGRIVIDPGHGGHDTGTIGPTGLMEKDLCLDVALRLGKIIRQRLPGAEVIFTREDDTYIPLEDRTSIANEAKADLFLSIHANSSQNHKARGIETYYLNLKGAPEDMEVAARENALAQGGVHDLQDLVTRIARNEKLEESREFAGDVQESLAKRLQKLSRYQKNRGVRKAPFVVLIGANMPSVLAEISFLSNPADEQLLKRPDARQRIAEGLYQGVASYLQGVNSLTYNLPSRDPGDRTIPVEHSGNQR